ncbi:MAG: redoxin family protein [Oscillospiraceae bacterium]|nr:redoxin family protein [Oscillospiraceae bacterium]
MDRLRAWWSAHRPTTRRLIQLYAALLSNAHLTGFFRGEIYRGKTKGLCVPGLNCYSCPAAVGACPLGTLQNALSASARKPAFYAVGVLLLFGLLLGRVICGFLCPFGLIQELLHKIPSPKLKKSRATRALSWLKYLVLGVFVVALPLYFAFGAVSLSYGAISLPAFCKYLCPAGTLEGAVALLLHPANGALRAMLGPLFASKLTILIVILAACVFLYRAFCRFLCPLGALYSLMSRLALLGVRIDPARCTDCGLCLRVCPVDIRRVGDRECVACGKCIGKCPEAAISLRAGKIVLQGPAAGAVKGRPSEAAGKSAPACRGGGPASGPVEGCAATTDPVRRRRLLAWVLALALLAGALVYFNLPASEETGPPAESTSQDEALGNAVGQTLPDFTLKTLDGETFTLSAQRGKPVVLNLWATWCGPCVKELPYFEAFAAAHPDAAVLAVHGPMITEDVSAWLAGTAYRLPFAVDEDGSLSALLGASNVLPHTVVLDRSGVVLYNAPGAVTPEQLEALYQSAPWGAGSLP